MSLQEAKAKKPDISLNLRSIADELVKAGRLSSEASDLLGLRTRRKEQLNWNPIELIAEEMFDDQVNLGCSLDLETLTIWLGYQAILQFVRIVPL